MDKKVHEHVTYDSSESAFFVQDLVKRFKTAMLNLQHCRPPEVIVSWSAPPLGWYKVNYDAAIFLDPPRSGLGAVIRDSHGHVIAWQQQLVKFVQNPEVAEACVVQMGVLMAQRLNLQHVLFEGDCLNLVTQLRQPGPSLSNIGGLVDETKTLVVSLNSFSFCFVRRNGNKVAHLLAKNCEDECFGSDVLPFLNPDVSWLFEETYVSYSGKKKKKKRI